MHQNQNRFGNYQNTKKKKDSDFFAQIGNAQR